MPEGRVPELLAELACVVPRRRLGAAKALRYLSEGEPHLVYPHFGLFAGMLHDQNSILRWNATLILGNLASVDGERRLDGMLDEYLAPIAGPHLIDAGNTIHGATAIGAAKPYLADRIVARILEVERALFDTPECRNVAIGQAIDAVGCLYPLIANQRAAYQFVSRQCHNSRPAVRKRAERFLRKWRMGQAVKTPS